MHHKKDLLRDQCKEIEDNNRMGKTRDLFKKDCWEVLPALGVLQLMEGVWLVTRHWP